MHGAILKEIPLFAKLTKKQIDAIQSVCKTIEVPEGKIVIHQDDSSFDLYIVVSGGVKVSLFDQSGREIILDTIKAGGFFGELSLFDSKPRSATVTATARSTLLVLKKDEFFKLIKTDFNLVSNFLTVIAERLRRADGRIETLAFLDVCGRVARIIMELTAKESKKLSDGSVVVRRPTHQEIAHQIGASREAVTKAIRSLSSRGIISISGRSITISPKQFEVL